MTATHTDEEWYTLDTLTFLDWDSFNPHNYTCQVTMKIVEGLTSTGDTVEVVYYATGDYEDRWVDVTGTMRDIIYWRPCRDR